MLKLFMLAVTLVLTACGTVSGFGSDMSKAGNAIENAAD